MAWAKLISDFVGWKLLRRGLTVLLGRGLEIRRLGRAVRPWPGHSFACIGNSSRAPYGRRKGSGGRTLVTLQFGITST
jgi:hypothetical protein